MVSMNNLNGDSMYNLYSSHGTQQCLLLYICSLMAIVCVTCIIHTKHNNTCYCMYILCSLNGNRIYKGPFKCYVTQMGVGVSDFP